MSTVSVVLIIIGILIALPVILFTIKYLISYNAPMDYLGRKFVQQKAKQHGVNIYAIPKPVWDDIVNEAVTGAKEMMKAGSEMYADERANLVRLLELDARALAAVLAGDRYYGGSANIQRILINHKIISADKPY